MEEWKQIAEALRTDIENCDCLLIGIGTEWSRKKRPEVKEAYQALYHIVKDKNYFIVTTVVDGAIFGSGLDASRIVAPCGNENWRQCAKSCTKDIWEKGEIPDDICPHCGAPLIGNTIAAEEYIEEGYFPQWERYKKWLAGTLNRNLLVLELGSGFKTPTVIRWPFEKTVFLNQKAHMYRVNGKFPQVSEEIRERAKPVAADSVEFMLKFSCL